MRKTNSVKLCAYAHRGPHGWRDGPELARGLAELAGERQLAHARSARELPADIGWLRRVLPQARGEREFRQRGAGGSASHGPPGPRVCGVVRTGAGSRAGAVAGMEGGA